MHPNMNHTTRWRIIACDLDGTLIGRHDRANPEDLDALHRARAAGLHVAICTGRNSKECSSVIGPLDLQGLGVFANGATVCDMATSKIIDGVYVAPEMVAVLVNFFGGFGHAVQVLVDDPVTRLPRYVLTDHAPPHRATQEWLLQYKTQSQVVTDLSPEDRQRVLRLSIVVNPSEKHQIEEGLVRQFDRQIMHHSVYSAVFDCQVIEAFPANVNKWTGLVRLCKAMGIDPADVVTIGDDINDIAMLRDATLSFAMGNAPESIRRLARQVTASQAEHGVAQVIDGILAGKWG